MPPPIEPRPDLLPAMLSLLAAGGLLVLAAVAVAVARRGRQRLAERDQTRFLRQQAALIAFLRREADQTADLLDNLQQATELVARTLGVARVGIWRMTADRAAIRCVDLYDLAADRHDAGATLNAADYPAYFRALATHEVIAAHDAHRDPRTAEFSPTYLTPLGIGAMLDVPLYLFGRLEGVLCYEHVGGPRGWRQDEQLFGLAAANLIALAEEQNERRRVAGELEKARRAAEAASQAKSAFVANMSHEVRTPINGVLGLTEVLLRGSPTPDQRENLELIRVSTEGLLTVLNDVLDFSKIEAGKLRIEAAPFDLRVTLASAVAVLAGPARGKGLRLRLDVEDRVPRWLLGDANRLRQVLLNLIGNAVKFTHEGEVRVELQIADCRLQIERQEDSTSTSSFPSASSSVNLQSAICNLQFSVVDTGIGIAPDKLARIFEPFEQADDSTTRRYGGTGLGLTITRRLVRLMDGDIDVTSEPGRGTTCRVRLTLPIADEPPAEAATPESQERPLRVLLAEDNCVNQLVVVRLLEKQGHQVQVVGDGRAAVEAADREWFDVVLMDVQMPQMDGLEATRTIRRSEDGTGRRVPIVALTAHAMEGDREQCLAAGCDGYVAKPIQVRQLLDTIARVVVRPM